MLASRILAALLAVSPVPALADAVTYRGHIADIPVVVEFAREFTMQTPPPFGRYFYEDKGVDIPLTFIDIKSDHLFITEASSCIEASCEADADGNAIQHTPGAIWELRTDDGGQHVTGYWVGDGSNTLPVTLELLGTRPFEITEYSTPESLTELATGALWIGPAMSLETSTYDFLKMEKVDMGYGDREAFGDNEIWWMADPRTKFRYPRISALSDGSDTDPTWAYLEARHWALNAEALACVARQYPGMGWNQYIADSVGTLAGYEDETVEVNYLSPTVMSWRESGSIWCGGAHPYNHSETSNIDVRAGAPLDLSKIFNGWVAKDYATGEAVDPATAESGSYRWGASAALIDFVLVARVPGDAGFEAECMTEDLIREYLTISFKEDDIVVFGLGGLPHAVVACGGDVLEMPLGDLEPGMFASTAAEYFPSLAS